MPERMVATDGGKEWRRGIKRPLPMVPSWFLCFDDGFGGGARSKFVSNPVSGKTGIHKTSAEGRGFFKSFLLQCGLTFCRTRYCSSKDLFFEGRSNTLLTPLIIDWDHSWVSTIKIPYLFTSAKNAKEAIKRKSTSKIFLLRHFKCRFL